MDSNKFPEWLYAVPHVQGTLLSSTIPPAPRTNPGGIGWNIQSFAAASTPFLWNLLEMRSSGPSQDRPTQSLCLTLSPLCYAAQKALSHRHHWLVAGPPGLMEGWPLGCPRAGAGCVECWQPVDAAGWPSPPQSRLVFQASNCDPQKIVLFQGEERSMVNHTRNP